MEKTHLDGKSADERKISVTFFRSSTNVKPHSARALPPRALFEFLSKRSIGENKEATFTEIKNSAGIEDSPDLSYHLNALNYLVVQKEGKYRLSELGQDAYTLMCKTATYTASNSVINFLRKQIPAVVIANAILWAAAIFAVFQFEGRLQQMTIFSFAALWFVSNIIWYSILERLRK